MKSTSPSGKAGVLRAIGPSISLAVSAFCAVQTANAASLRFVESVTRDYDYGRQTVLPDGFGDGEFTMELWIKPDDSYPVGPVAGRDATNDRLNWGEEDNQPYSMNGWWVDGNFLLDGFNNRAFGQGTMALQFYGGGRIRWFFGDGINAGPGNAWAVSAYPATRTPSLLDGRWHQVTLVRRWAGSSSADLELWVDGALIATETTPARVDMAASYWDGVVDGGWYWGSEKQAAENSYPNYEDFKGLLDEIRFWSVAKSPQDIQSNFDAPVTGSEPGLVGVYSMSEGSGTVTCNALAPSQCINLVQMKPGYWAGEDAPFGSTIVRPNPPSNLTVQ